MGSQFIGGGWNIIGTDRKEEIGVTYAFGGTAPLDPAEIAMLLTEELNRCYAAFAPFQKLVMAHRAFIVPNNEALLDQMKGGRPR